MAMRGIFDLTTSHHLLQKLTREYEVARTFDGTPARSSGVGN
jgi:hypothetical protein